MDSNYPWGVPTRSCVEDAEYQRLVILAAAAEKVIMIPDLASDIALHNQVNAALHRIGLGWIDAEILYRSTLLLPWFLPKEFHQLLNPKWLIEEKLGEIREASVALEIAKDELDKRHYQQIQGLLIDLQKQLELMKDSCQTDQNPLASIRHLWKVLNQATNRFSSAFRDMRFFGMGTGYKLRLAEREANEEATALYAQHQALTKKSDIIVRFDESYVDTKTNHGTVCIPLQSMFAPPFYTSLGLGYRVDLRDLITEKLQTNGSITVNGMKINLVGIPGSIHLMCKTDAKPTQALVDLLGITITPGNHGDTLRPDEKIVKERTWVYRYRQMTRKEQLAVPFYGWAENLLGKYQNGFESDYGIPLTDEEKVERLHYLLANPTRLGDFS